MNGSDWLVPRVSGMLGVRRRGGSRFGRNVRQRLNRAAAFAQRSGRSSTFTRRQRNRVQSGQGVTEQHDARRIYQKRRMPFRRKRRWKVFRSKVLAVSEKDLGSQTVVFNVALQASNIIAGNQTVFNCCLYPSSSILSYWNDLNSIGALNAAAVTTPTTGLAIEASSKVLFQSAVMDLTIRNDSTLRTGGTYAPNAAARMEVDVYELLCNRGDEAGAIYTDVLSMFGQNPTRTQAIGGGATTEIVHTLRGVTPFDLTYSLGNFRIKILRKTKYQISNGDQVTYQVRDPRRHSVMQRELTSNEGPIIPRLSRIVIVIGKLAPGLPVADADGSFQEVLDFGLTRKYFYKIENYSEDRTAYIIG